MDLLHLHSVFTPNNAWATRLGTPYILTPNGGYSPLVIHGRNRIMKHVWMRWLERGILNGAAAIHAVSPQETRDLETLGVKPPVVLIPNGVESVAQSPDAIARRRGDWLFLGRLAIEQKGLDLLLEGYARACGRSPLPRLVIAGPDFRGGRQRLEEMVRRLNLVTRVEIRDACVGAAKEALLASASLFIHTSRWEGLPLAVVEAMGAAVPVMVTPGVNFDEEVLRSEAGWLAGATPDEIAGAMEIVARAGAEELARRGACARRLVEERFLWSRIAGEMAGLYRKAIARGDGDAG
jgi:glycosyltransferase involved in cell wall biosynthesis